MPELVYAGNETMLAFADRGVYTFTGKDTPKEGKQLAVEEEIQSIFWDDSYFGLVFYRPGGRGRPDGADL